MDLFLEVMDILPTDTALMTFQGLNVYVKDCVYVFSFPNYAKILLKIRALFYR